MLFIRAKKLIFLLTHPRALLIFLRYRITPTIEHKYVLSQKIDTIIDIGANRGQFALAASLLTNANIISFEPLTRPYNIYKSAFKNSNTHTIHNVAIAPDSGISIMHVANSDDSSSLLSIGKAQVELYPGTQEIGTIEIKTAPLDCFLSESDIHGKSLLKIDVQGFELQTIDACSNLLTHFTLVYCECSFIELYDQQAFADDVIRRMHEFDFVLTGLFNISYKKDGQPIQADLLFEKKRSK